MCGSPATINSTGAAECYGWAWQTIYIECKDTMNKKCGMEITISADHSSLDSSWNKAINFWNSLNKH